MAVPQTSMEGVVQQEVSDEVLVNYGTLEPSTLYVCGKCGAKKRLWRDFGLVLMAPKREAVEDGERKEYQAALTCGSCTLRLTGEIPTVEQGDVAKIRFPAIPIQVEDGKITFCPAHNIPKNGLRWWHELPE